MAESFAETEFKDTVVATPNNVKSLLDTSSLAASTNATEMKSHPPHTSFKELLDTAVAFIPNLPWCVKAYHTHLGEMHPGQWSGGGQGSRTISGGSRAATISRSPWRKRTAWRKRATTTSIAGSKLFGRHFTTGVCSFQAKLRAAGVVPYRPDSLPAAEAYSGGVNGFECFAGGSSGAAASNGE